MESKIKLNNDQKKQLVEDNEKTKWLIRK